MSLSIDAKTAALVLIDLQAGIVGREIYPHPSSTVVANSARLAETFRARDGAVVLVNVSFSADGGNRINHPVDEPMPATVPPPGWDRLVPEIGQGANDILITKHNWGAFYGTALDLELRRRSITTIVLGGISTNLGVESTARSAYEHNYGLVFAEDAMASHLSVEAHHFAVKTIFPRIGRVRSTADVLSALG